MDLTLTALTGIVILGAAILLSVAGTALFILATKIFAK